jgi:hypothetical protein
MRLDSTALLEVDELIIFKKWAKYLRFRAKYEIDPIAYLRALYGFVPIDILENFLALDDMSADSHRMKKDLETQTKEFENKMKKKGKDFNRL